jgi:hypothetical protein
MGGQPKGNGRSVGGRSNIYRTPIEDQWETNRTPIEHQWETNGRESKGSGSAMGEKSGKMSRKRKNGVISKLKDDFFTFF